MAKTELSQQQITDAVGSYSEVADTVIGEVAHFDPSPVPSPSYDAVAQHSGVDSRYTAFDIPTASASGLRNYPGLRVALGVRVPCRSGGLQCIYLPGIVLPWDTVRFGCLYAGPDILADEASLSQAIQRPLSDLQQNLLLQTYGMHTRGAGEHGSAPPSVADAPHGAVIAVTAPGDVASLHNTVHAYMRDGLAASISATQALHIGVGHEIRPVRERVVELREAVRIIVPREYQLPPADASVLLGAGELAVGMTLAAVRSKLSYPQPNIAAGMKAVLGRDR